MITAAGIVLYNPDLVNLNKSIKELVKSVNYIYLVDNASNNIDEVIKLIQEWDNIKLIRNNKNLGIAIALNQLLQMAYSDDIKFLLTLDQDSVLEDIMFRNMMKYSNTESVAVICPIINDLNKKKRIEQNSEILDLDRCITSGSIMNLKVCKDIGFFDEKMFIDYVDFDYCKRIKIAGKRIIRVRDAMINHEIGKRSCRKFLFWTVYPTNHSPIRIYYYVRNIKYYLKKFKKQLYLKERLVEHKYLIWKFVSILLYENNKKQKLSMFLKGLKDSNKMI